MSPAGWTGALHLAWEALLEEEAGELETIDDTAKQPSQDSNASDSSAGWSKHGHGDKLQWQDQHRTGQDQAEDNSSQHTL